MADSRLNESAPSRPVTVGARDALRSICKAGGDLGCSCADQNYQWFGPSCQRDIVAAYKTLLAAPPAAAGREDERDAIRYRRLRVLGCAPYGTMQLDQASVLRFTGLDEVVDADLSWTPSRGEASAVTPHEPATAWQPIETAPHVPHKRFLIGRLIGARFDWVATAERRELDTVWGRWDSGKLSISYIPTHWMEMPALAPKGAA